MQKKIYFRFLFLNYFFLCIFVAAMEYTLNCNGRLLDLCEPQVMGILNVTPDSFYAGSRQQTKQAVAERAAQIVGEGGSIIDIGACSTRPGSQPATEQEEMERLRMALRVVRLTVPDAILSVDTFRPDVARMAVEEFGVDMVNDVGLSAADGGQRPVDMFRMVSRLRVPYIYMSRRATVKAVLIDCAEAVDMLRSMGQKDIVVDPGFGFGKTMDENFAILNGLERMQMLRLPVLVGVSRKRMVWQTLGCSPDEALNGTTVLNTIALQRGASILRVHDVRQAAECISMVQMLNRRQEAETL